MKRRAALALAAVLVAAPAARAEPTGKAECIAAHRDAQLARRDGRLRAARESLVVCANDACPHPIVAECTPWLSEVEHALPTVVFEARANGQDLTDVRVAIDGRLTSERLDGRAVDVDPGVHVVRFERAGSAPIEERLVVAEGEKARVVRVTFASSSPSGGTRTPAPASEAKSGLPWTAWALGGAGVLALGGFALFAITGVNAEGDLASCKPACPPSRIDPVRRDYVTADVFLGVGVVALAGAAILVLVNGGATSRSSSAAY